MSDAKKTRKVKNTKQYRKELLKKIDSVDSKLKGFGAEVVFQGSPYIGKLLDERKSLYAQYGVIMRGLYE